MKIKFDENISVRLFDAICRLETDPALQLTSVVQEYGHGAADPAWMFEFARSGGVAMVSGDHQILQNPVNLKAYRESGLVSIWPPPGWPDLKRWGQAAFICRWWPAVKIRIAASAKGDRWRIPLQWTADPDGFKSLKDPRIDP